MVFFVMKRGARTVKKVFKMGNGLQWSSARCADMKKSREVNAVNCKKSKSWLDLYISDEFVKGALVGFCVTASAAIFIMVVFRFVD
jgi:hypothetical protein